jgi:ribosome-associated toxin RatA of RatAB toxin-antitoxin module
VYLTLRRHPKELVYKVVSDIQAYPQFVPGCRRLDILRPAGPSCTSDKIRALVTVQVFGLLEKYISNVRLKEDDIIVRRSLYSGRQVTGS